MKNILVVSVGAPTGESMVKEVDSIFKDYAHTEFCLCHQLARKSSGFDIVIFSSRYSELLCAQYKLPNILYLPARRVINYTNIREIIELEKGTRALLVNDCEETANEAIDQLIEIGLNEIQYIPYYPGCKTFSDTSIAITPGELSYVPSQITKLIDIGVRTLDIQTIYDLMLLLDAGHLFTRNFVTRYLKEIVTISKSFSQSHKKAEQSEKLLETIFNSVESGIAYIGSNHNFIRTNLIFETILNQSKEKLYQKNFDKVMENKKISLKEGTFVVPINERTVLFKIKEVETENIPAFLVTADYADNISKMNQRIKIDSTPRPNRKLYTFDDYLTWDERCMKLITLAKKFTKTDGTVLIQGESGTGKEILAQSIHNGSARRNYPFIPVNITALSQSLIESELFGYEDASFTGAKKGGRPGIFELADKGTVFIDEIGDASLEFQVKLLRTLESKCIRRVGGVEEIPIDVRIIVATNKDLPDLIGRNMFREDLFFRLNILPLSTLPLRQRKADIMPLMRHFLSFYFDETTLNQLLNRELCQFFENYRWKGNVRELINITEYLRLTYEGGAFPVSSLPSYMHVVPEFKNHVFLSEHEYNILSKLGECGSRSTGRTRLQAILAGDGFDIGSGKIRNLLKELEQKGLIDQNPSGCNITDKGRHALSRY